MGANLCKVYSENIPILKGFLVIENIYQIYTITFLVEQN